MAFLLAALISPLMGKLFKLETNLLIKACFYSSRQSPDRHTLNLHIDFDKLFTIYSICFSFICADQTSILSLKTLKNTLPVDPGI